MTDISERTSGFVRDLGEAARQNPVSAALIGMGMVWLFTGGWPVRRAGEFAWRSRLDRIPGAADDAFESTRSTIKSGVDTVGERVASATDALREGGASALDSAARVGRDYAGATAGYVKSMPRAGAEMFGTVRSNLSDVFEAQPLALGAIGLAIGAGIAAALPPSEMEAEYFGETSDTFKAKAAEFATEQTGRASEVAGAVVDAVTEEARRQGLTMQAAKSAVGDISAKVGRVTDTAGKSISERITPKAT